MQFAAHALKPAERGAGFAPLAGLQCPSDLDSLWQSCLRIFDDAFPYLSCSLMFDIVDYEPARARHHVGRTRDPHYVPATSLSISKPFLAAHPQIPLYTYSQIASEDPDATRRRLKQEPEPEWDDYAHLAFWCGDQLDAVLSIHRPTRHVGISSKETALLEKLHPAVDAGLRHLRALESEQMKWGAFEQALEHMPGALMLVACDGTVMGGNAAASRACARWNDGLRNLRQRLPENVHALFDGAHEGRGNGDPAGAGHRRVDHPTMPGLFVRIERRWLDAQLRRRHFYIVRFADENREPADASRHARVEGALQRLSPRERRVALLASQGLSNQEIAEGVDRSPRTIETQIASVMRKLNLQRRAQLVRLLL